MLEHIDSYNFDQSSDQLAYAFKKAGLLQEHIKPASPEFKQLERFKQQLLKRIRANRKPDSGTILEQSLTTQV